MERQVCQSDPRLLGPSPDIGDCPRMAKPPEGNRRDALDSFDQALIDFVLSWVPYGGPPVDEILPRFGILSYELADRVREIASVALRRNLSAENRIRVAQALAAVRSAPNRSPRHHR